VTVLDALAPAFKDSSHGHSDSEFRASRSMPPEPLQEELATLIDDESVKLNELTTRLLRTARLETSETQLRKEEVAISQLIEQIIGEQAELLSGHEMRTSITNELMLSQLRDAIRTNQVSFPAQVPTFTKPHRPGIERQVVQLYFVRGWRSGTIARRYDCSPMHVRQILTRWKRHALVAGYARRFRRSKRSRGWPRWKCHENIDNNSLV
jgi:signal transduction histidine kinase